MWKPYNAVRLGNGEVNVRTGDGSRTVRDGTGAVWRVLTLFAEGHSIEDFLERCSRAGIANGRDVHDRLASANLLPRHAPYTDRYLGYLSELGKAWKGVDDRRETEVSRELVVLAGTGKLRAELEGSLASVDAHFTDWSCRIPEDASVVGLSCADWHDLSALTEASAWFVKQGLSFLNVWVDQSKIFVGPFTIPGVTACFDCYLEGLSRRIEHQREFEDRRGPNVEQIALGMAPGRLPARWAACQAVSMVMLAKHGVGLPTHPAEILITDLESPETVVELVIKSAVCPTCRG